MYANQGLRCNAIRPGATATNIAESIPAERLDPVGAARAGEYASLTDRPVYVEVQVPASSDSAGVTELTVPIAAHLEQRDPEPAG